LFRELTAIVPSWQDRQINDPLCNVELFMSRVDELYMVYGWAALTSWFHNGAVAWSALCAVWQNTHTCRVPQKKALGLYVGEVKLCLVSRTPAEADTAIASTAKTSIRLDLIRMVVPYLLSLPPDT